ncbi:MAG: hypothetical protein ACYTFQ_10175 [Planctomycetota bacterium]
MSTVDAARILGRLQNLLPGLRMALILFSRLLAGPAIAREGTRRPESRLSVRVSTMALL